VFSKEENERVSKGLNNLLFLLPLFYNRLHEEV
jgi:hypothetical protein